MHQQNAHQHDNDDRGRRTDGFHDPGDGAHRLHAVGPLHAGGDRAAAGIGQADALQHEHHGAGSQQIRDLALDDQEHGDALQQHGQHDGDEGRGQQVHAIPQHKAHHKATGHRRQGTGRQVKTAHGQGNRQRHRQDRIDGDGTQNGLKIADGQEARG